MSAPLAGNFQDHYVILGVEPKADSETIQTAYAALAKKFHPNNGSTGDKEKFDAVNLAYETLVDPLLRREFDKVKGIGQEEGSPTFSGPEFFNSLGREAGVRNTLLCVLYDRRRTNPFRPGISMRHLENMLVVSSDELAFTLWYLKQRSLVRADDKSSLHITVEGMDYLETHQPPPESVMSFLKPAALRPQK